MQQGDFDMLPPQIQMNYQNYIQQLDQMEVEKQKQIQLAESGFIPTTGPLVPCDFYVNTKDGGTQRVKIYSDAIRWLLDKLDQQGTTEATLQNVNQGALADQARMLGQGQNGNGMGNGMPIPHPHLGVPNAIGSQGVYPHG